MNIVTLQPIGKSAKVAMSNKFSDRSLLMAKAENRLKGSYRNILNLPISPTNVTVGMEWYSEAHQVAKTVGVLAGYHDDMALRVGAGVLSALSPMRDWDLNIAIAILLVTEGKQKHTKIQHDKALAMLAGKEPIEILGDRANKTKAFYLAIMNPNNNWTEPVIDRHAVAVYMGRTVTDKEIKALESPKVYNRIVRAYMKASELTGINHHALQAMTWTQWRENKGLSGKTSRQLAIE